MPYSCISRCGSDSAMIPPLLLAILSPSLLDAKICTFSLDFAGQMSPCRSSFLHCFTYWSVGNLHVCCLVLNVPNNPVYLVATVLSVPNLLNDCQNSRNHPLFYGNIWKPPSLKTFGQPSRSSSSKNFSSAASASSMAPPQSRSSIDSVFVRVFLCIFWQLNHDLHGFSQAQIRKYEALDIIRWF